MAWTKLRVLYNVAAQDYTVILGTGGVPSTVINTTRGLAIRSDGGQGTTLYETSDSGRSWQSQSADAGVRIELDWVAGADGKPGINADILSATESVRMITDGALEVLGTNASSDDVTHSAEGGLLLTTDGADGDGVVLLPHLDADQSLWTSYTWGTDQEVHWECWFKTGSAAQIDDCIIWAGLKLTNTDVVATDADQVFFRYENAINDGEFQAVNSIGGTDDAHDTALALAASTLYHLKIVIDSARIARFYINDTLYETSAALTDATDLIPYIGVEADGAAAAKILTVYRQKISRLVA